MTNTTTKRTELEAAFHAAVAAYEAGTQILITIGWDGIKGFSNVAFEDFVKRYDECQAVLGAFFALEADGAELDQDDMPIDLIDELRGLRELKDAMSNADSDMSRFRESGDDDIGRRCFYTKDMFVDRMRDLFFDCQGLNYEDLPWMVKDAIDDDKLIAGYMTEAYFSESFELMGHTVYLD